jgi:hypothetical protein
MWDNDQFDRAEQSGYNPYAPQAPAPEPPLWQVPDTIPAEWLED